MLRLRTADGVPLSVAQQPELQPAASWATANGLLENVDGRLRLTRRGRLLSNEVFSRLLPGVA